MPRQARLDVPGALHHIMVRGINKSDIFKDDQDKALFIERLGQNVIEGKCSVYAWVLMENHVHLLFKSGQRGISAVMRKLLTWYAQYFNRRHGRSGHLFENRYKSILCDEDNYLLALVRYIHLNPIRGDMVTTLEELDSYPWSGHSVFMGKAEHDWMDTGYILSPFGGRKKAARNAYHRFMGEGRLWAESPISPEGACQEQGRLVASGILPEKESGRRIRRAYPGEWGFCQRHSKRSRRENQTAAKAPKGRQDASQDY